MAHDHAGHHHHHAHHDDSSGARAPDRRFALAIALNLGYVAIEVAVGVVAGSAALLADAAHNLSDVLGLGAAWIAVVLARRPADLRFTWGFRNATILSALFNGAMLMLVAGALGWEALGRIAAPVPVQGGLVVVAAIAGAVVNVGTALLFLRGRKADVNLRGAYLHMMADAAVSLGVALSGAAVLATGHAWIDPVVALVVVAVIIGSTWDLLRESIELSLAASPRRVRVEEVAAFLASRPGVVDVHDLHVWPLGSTGAALSAHLVTPEGHPGDAALRELTREVATRFGVGHAVFQIELDHPGGCPLACGCPN